MEDRLARVRARMAAENMPDLYVRDLSNIAWLTGFEGVFDDEPAHAAFITPKGATIHSDSRYEDALARAAAGTPWKVNAQRASHSAWIAESFEHFHTLRAQGKLPASFAQDAEACAHEGRGVAAVGSAGDGSVTAGNPVCDFGIEDTMQLAEFRALEAAFAKNTYQPALVETSDFVRSLRAVKDAVEIEAMRAAQAITDAAFAHICDFMREGMTEREVQLELEQTMRKLGADDLAFSSIVATGANGAAPHSIPGGTRLVAGDMVVLDFGARKNGYCSDMTRMVCVGHASQQALDVYAAVRRANETVEALLRPGVTGAQAHETAERVLEESGFGGMMGHGLGHGVGLDIHELPNLSPRNQQPLEVGNVVTVEPGVYIPGLLGCRLEDFGVITPDGFEVFTQSGHELVII